MIDFNFENGWEKQKTVIIIFSTKGKYFSQCYAMYNNKKITNYTYKVYKLV